MGRLAFTALLASFVLPARADPQLDAAIQALRRDSSLKVRTQAAIVLGQRGANDAVHALREAVAEDRAASVRIAAVTALAKIGDRRARPTLRAASEADPDPAVRRAAERALEALGPLAFALDDGAGPAPARAVLREGIERLLKARGFAVADGGDVRLRPSVRVDVDGAGGKIVISVRASVTVVDCDGRVDLLESSARASIPGAVPDGQLAAYSARAVDAAARTLSEDLAAKLAGR
jgi:hypothetical protein